MPSKGPYPKIGVSYPGSAIHPVNLAGVTPCNPELSSISTSPALKGRHPTRLTRRAPYQRKGWKATAAATPGTSGKCLVMDKETLDHYGLEPGQIKENLTVTGLDLSQARQGHVFFIGDDDNHVTLEVTGDCEPCQKMDALIPGLREEIFGKRGILTVVLQGGDIKVGDAIRLEP